MIIKIEDNRTIDEICRQFSASYPFLKLEFFDEPHKWGEGSSMTRLVPHEMKMKAIRKKQRNGEMEVNPWDHTGEVEQKFKKLFGLYVQVFRRHGFEWVQTLGTDILDLSEQNELGKRESADLLEKNEKKM